MNIICCCCFPPSVHKDSRRGHPPVLGTWHTRKCGSRVRQNGANRAHRTQKVSFFYGKFYLSFRHFFYFKMDLNLWKLLSICLAKAWTDKANKLTMSSMFLIMRRISIPTKKKFSWFQRLRTFCRKFCFLNVRIYTESLTNLDCGHGKF